MNRTTQIQVEREAWKASIEHHIKEELPELSELRRYKIRNTLEIFAREIKKHPNDVTRDDLESFFASLRSKKPWTVRDYKMILKRFYRNRKGKKFVDWIRVPTNITSCLGPEDLISEEEFRAMVSRAENLRDKAMLSVLRESAFRPQELLSLKRRNVNFDRYGAILHIENGKTGARPVRIVSSAPLLANWMENEPLKDDGAPLWVNLSTSGKYAPLRPTGLRRIIRKIANEANVKKRIWPYLFRHTRNTELSTKLTEAPFCGYAGWKIGSKMPAYYVHLSGKDVDKAVLKSYGISSNEAEDDELKLPKQCARCGSINSPEQDTCAKCGLGLSVKALIEQDEKIREMEIRNEAMFRYLSKPTDRPLQSLIEEVRKERSTCT